jgi:hypothetical protein
MAATNIAAIMLASREHEATLHPCHSSTARISYYSSDPSAVFLYKILMGYISTKFNERSFNEAYST